MVLAWMQRAWFSAAVVLMAGFASWAQDNPLPSEQDLEKEAKERIASFKRTVNKAKVDEEIVAAIRDLATLKHPRILQELKRFVAHGSERVRRQAIGEIAKYRPDPEAAKLLMGALLQEAAKASQDDQARDIGHEVACEILMALRGFQLTEEMTAKLVSLFRNPNLTLASAAVRACGEARILGAVDGVISALREAEGIQAQRPQLEGGDHFVRHFGGGSSTPKMTPEQAKQMSLANRRDTMTVVCRQTLEVLLGERRNSAAEFADYWVKNKARLLEEERRRRQEQEE